MKYRVAVLLMLLPACASAPQPAQTKQFALAPLTASNEHPATAPSSASDEQTATASLFTSDEQAALAENRRVGTMGSFASWMLDVEGAWEKARVIAEECIAASPGNEVCHSVLISTFTRRGLYDERLLEAIRSCLARAPDMFPCWSALATYELKRGELVKVDVEVVFPIPKLRRVAPRSNDSNVRECAVAVATHDAQKACACYRKACDNGQRFACRRERAICAAYR